MSDAHTDSDIHDVDTRDITFRLCECIGTWPQRPMKPSDLVSVRSDLVVAALIEIERLRGPLKKRPPAHV